MTPLVSVVMSVYNGERYLEAAINSILNQSFTDFEFIIINDGSVDNTSIILQKYEHIDERIRVYTQDKSGLVASLNRGCQLAQGKYIARMDADDISLPERFCKQVMFMEANPKVGVCGTWIKTIGQAAGRLVKYPTDDINIRCYLLFDSPICHPSAMMRKELFEKLHLTYNPIHVYGQDYRFWIDCSNFVLMANIGEVLLLYRSHSGQIGQKYKNPQSSSAKISYVNILNRLGINPTEEELEMHNSFRTLRFPVNQNYIQQAEAWLSRIQIANKETGTYDESALEKIIGQRWFLLCNAATDLGWSIWKRFWQSPLSQGANLSKKHQIKFLVKASLNWQSQFREQKTKNLKIE
ncbi:glycosyltransferase [Laspinema sp. D1]|uniref:glycosyltransferase family 2 protein n=1 Tax=Laspinema palackyanum TaxID=3231601 RepID=UPI003470993C|nr:glycosyltransferase [Laspinema sp. D2b]